jgi:bacterioferritin-associated ferredoxin
MIVCSCNVLTDHDVRAALSGDQAAPRTTGEVYDCLGCSAQMRAMRQDYPPRDGRSARQR